MYHLRTSLQSSWSQADSPIIGAGLYVDNEVGAAVATGLGEVVLKSLSSFLIVELMRNGAHPEDACKEALERIVREISKL
ncbi:MAG: isoaspartyl peptidase/L-asparaginase [Saprospiraceae bacterium]